jgi:uncharacterized membrane protein
MSGLTGYSVGQPNYFLRFFAIIFLGLLGMGIVLSWRSSLLFAAEYQEAPISRQTLEVKKQNQIKQQKLLVRTKNR